MRGDDTSGSWLTTSRERQRRRRWSGTTASGLALLVACLLAVGWPAAGLAGQPQGPPLVIARVPQGAASDPARIPPASRAPGTGPGALPTEAEATFYVVMPLGFADALLKVSKTGLQVPALPLKDRFRQEERTGAGVQSTYLPIDFRRHYALRGRLLVRMREQIEPDDPNVLPAEKLLPVMDARVEIVDPNLVVGGKPLVIDTRYSKLLAPGESGSEPHGQAQKERGFRDPQHAQLPTLADGVPELQAGEFIVRLQPVLPEGGVLQPQHIYELPDPIEMVWADPVQELEREVRKFVASALEGAEVAFSFDTFYNLPLSLTTPNAGIQGQFLLMALLQNWKDHFRRYPDDAEDGASGVQQVDFDPALLDVPRDDAGRRVPLVRRLHGIQRLTLAEQVARTGVEYGRLLIDPIADTLGGVWNATNITDFIFTMVGTLVEVTLKADFRAMEQGTEALRKGVEANESLMKLRRSVIEVGQPLLRQIDEAAAGLAGLSRAKLTGALNWLGTVEEIAKLPSVKSNLPGVAKWITEQQFGNQTLMLQRLKGIQTAFQGRVSHLRTLLDPPPGFQMSGSDELIQGLFNGSLTGDTSAAYIFNKLQWLAAVSGEQNVFQELLDSQAEVATADRKANFLEEMYQTINIRLIPSAVEAARRFRFPAQDPAADDTLLQVREAVQRIANEQVRVRDQFVGVLQKVREVSGEVDNNLNFFLTTVASIELLVGVFGANSAFIVLFPTFQAAMEGNPYLATAVFTIGLTQATAKLLSQSIGVYQGEVGKAAVHDLFNSAGDGIKAPFGSLDDLWSAVLTRAITLETVPALDLLEQAATRLQAGVLDGIKRPRQAQTTDNLARLAPAYQEILTAVGPYQVQRNQLLFQLSAVQLAMVPHVLSFSQRADFQDALNKVRTSLSGIDTALSAYVSAVAEGVTDTNNPFLETDYWTRQNYNRLLAEINGFRNTFLPRLQGWVNRYRYGPVVTVGIVHDNLPRLVEEGSSHDFGLLVANSGTVEATVKSVRLNSSNGLGRPPDGVTATAFSPQEFVLAPGQQRSVTCRLTFQEGQALEFVPFGVAVELDRWPGITSEYFTFVHEKWPQVVTIKPSGTEAAQAVGAPYPVQNITVGLGSDYQRAVFWTWVDGRMTGKQRQGRVLSLLPGSGPSELQPGLHTVVVQSVNILTNEGDVWPVQFRVGKEDPPFTDFAPAHGEQTASKTPAIQVRHTLLRPDEYPHAPPGLSERFDIRVDMTMDGQPVQAELDLNANGNVQSGLIRYAIPAADALSPFFRVGWHTATVTVRVVQDRLHPAGAANLTGKIFTASWLFRVVQKGD